MSGRNQLYGYDPQTASKSAVVAWCLLKPREKLLISRHNQFKTKRDLAIRTLKKQGLTLKTISELSGFSVRTIAKIVRPEGG